MEVSALKACKWNQTIKIYWQILISQQSIGYPACLIAYAFFLNFVDEGFTTFQ